MSQKRCFVHLAFTDHSATFAWRRVDLSYRVANDYLLFTLHCTYFVGTFRYKYGKYVISSRVPVWRIAHVHLKKVSNTMGEKMAKEGLVIFLFFVLNIHSMKDRMFVGLLFLYAIT